MQNWFGLPDQGDGRSTVRDCTAARIRAAEHDHLDSGRDYATEPSAPVGKTRIGPKILAAVNADISRKRLLLPCGIMVDATIISAPNSTERNRIHLPLSATDGCLRCGERPSVNIDTAFVIRDFLSPLRPGRCKIFGLGVSLAKMNGFCVCRMSVRALTPSAPTLQPPQ